MEVARIISEELAPQVAEKMGLMPAYEKRTKNMKNRDVREYKQILSVKPTARNFWENKLIPVWCQFWKEGLKPETAINKLKSSN